jgi:signal transduction histidine kinase
LILALVALGSMVIVFFLYRHYQQRQLKEIDIRNKISRDLHDDIGATLSSIKIYGELANSVLENKPDQSKSMITKITEQSNDLMHRMGDVIWSMKSAEETKNSLSARIKNYSSELLAPKEIACSIDIDENLCNEISNPITRKNLLLIIKEALNNIAKYSGATQAGISFREDKSGYVLSIFDNGKGIKAEPDTHGNGLVNMKQRCEQLGGNWMIESAAGKGVTIICTFTRSLFSKS